MADKDMRWQQRFQNYEQSFKLLERTLAITSPSEAERGGIIQFFEVTFELAWKVLKDYLQAQGYQVQSPRETLKQAFQAGLLQDGHTWMKALDDRNLTTHAYDEAAIKKVESLIRETYSPLLHQLYDRLSSEIPQ